MSDAVGSGQIRQRSTGLTPSRRDPPVRKLTTKLLATYQLINERYYAAKKEKQLANEKAEAEAKKIGTGDTVGAYRIEEVLGKGSFGAVFCAVDTRTNEKVAIKVIKPGSAFRRQAAIEVKLLDLLNKHDPQEQYNVVKAYEHFECGGQICIVFERLSYNLYELLRRTNFHGVSLILVRKFARQILSTLIYLSSPEVDIIHCDLKPENILIRNPDRSAIKVIDFGSSCPRDKTMYKYVQSRFYRSPEVILEMKYDQAIDIWSLGCILVELHTGNPLFSGRNEIDQLRRFLALKGLPPPNMLQTESKVHEMFDIYPTIRSLEAAFLNRAGASYPSTGGLVSDSSAEFDVTGAQLTHNGHGRPGKRGARSRDDDKDNLLDSTVGSSLSFGSSVSLNNSVHSNNLSMSETEAMSAALAQTSLGSQGGNNPDLLLVESSPTDEKGRRTKRKNSGGSNSLSATATAAANGMTIPTTTTGVLNHAASLQNLSGAAVSSDSDAPQRVSAVSSRSGSTVAQAHIGTSPSVQASNAAISALNNSGNSAHQTVYVNLNYILPYVPNTPAQMPSGNQDPSSSASNGGSSSNIKDTLYPPVTSNELLARPFYSHHINERGEYALPLYRLKPTPPSRSSSDKPEPQVYTNLADVIGVYTGGPGGRRKNEARGHTEEDYLRFLDFLQRLLEYDPARRIKPHEAIKHPFITEEPG